jgi:hypothetical protein
MDASRHRVADGSDPSVEPWWGIQGPGIDGREEWRGDHALVNWRYIWDAEVKRRGLPENKVPEVIERYPYLAAGQPDKLPGIEALRKIARDAVVVSTADPFHHGIGYGDSKEDASQPDEAGLQRARGMIEEAIAYLEKGDYPGYQQSCIRAKSDARDSGQVYRYLRGPMKGEIRDLTYSDATGLYDQPPPTWVAGALIEWTPVD